MFLWGIRYYGGFIAKLIILEVCMDTPEIF